MQLRCLDGISLPLSSAALHTTTTGLERMIQRNPSYDARALLQGVPAMLGTLVTQVGGHVHCRTSVLDRGMMQYVDSNVDPDIDPSVDPNMDSAGACPGPVCGCMPGTGRAIATISLSANRGHDPRVCTSSTNSPPFSNLLLRCSKTRPTSSSPSDPSPCRRRIGL